MIKTALGYIERSVTEAVTDITVLPRSSWASWLVKLLLKLRDNLVDPTQFDAVWTETKRLMDERLTDDHQHT